MQMEKGKTKGKHVRFAEDLVQAVDKHYLTACFMEKLVWRVEGKRVACVIRGQEVLRTHADPSTVAFEQSTARAYDSCWECGFATPEELMSYRRELRIHISKSGHIDVDTKKYLLGILAEADTLHQVVSVDDMIAELVPSVPEQPSIISELVSELIADRRMIANIKLRLKHLRIDADEANRIGDLDTVVKILSEIDECEELLKQHNIHKKLVFINLVESM